MCVLLCLLLTLSCVQSAGPSTAVALTVLQPPSGGKALKTRPAYKGMLRAKLPALCGIGALFRWLIVRFTKLAESIPRPGSTQFKRFYLWPGRAGEAAHAVLDSLAAWAMCSIVWGLKAGA
jgi:hypothetical protein